MGARVFNNDFFELWLGKETDRILNKIDKETITSDEMILLILKAQTNHFSHMDDDIKGGLSQLDQKIEDLSHKTDQRFEKIDQRFEKIEQRFDSMRTEIRWGFGMCMGMFASLFVKLIMFS